jgi:2-keto-3-deoxy-L-rhamnonate aldolase RhmA
MIFGERMADTIGDMILSARGAELVPIVRPPFIDLAFISRCLDLGALGVLIPHVETAEQVTQVIQASKYYPHGRRGISSRQPQTNYKKLDDLNLINESIMIEVMVESKTAIENIEQLIVEPFIDVIVVGLNDLSQDLGLWDNRNHELIIELVNKVIYVSQSKGIAVGLQCNDIDEGKFWIDKGIQMLGYSSDVALILESSTKFINAIRNYPSSND